MWIAWKFFSGNAIFVAVERSGDAMSFSRVGPGVQ